MPTPVTPTAVTLPFPTRRVSTPTSTPTPPPAAFVVDCADCQHQHTSVCDDCVVSFIVDRHPEDAVVVDADQARAVRLLEQAGLVPAMRHTRRAG